jgi:hypothetical protein
MSSSVQQQLAAIIAEIDRTGHANVLRLTVLKKWFRQPRRLAAFGLWVARRAAARGALSDGVAVELLGQAHTLLTEPGLHGARPDWTTTEMLYRRSRAFQDQFKRQAWGPVRMIRNWDLLLVEQGLALYLGHCDSPTAGYRLAVDDCAHYDPRYGTDLNGPSRDRLEALLAHVTSVEAAAQSDSPS